MPVERSAGAVIFRKNKKIKYLLLHYQYKTKFWGLPKGLIEPGETPEQTAIREIQEETGLTKLKFLPIFRQTEKYFYKREGKTIYKEVIYFLAQTKQKKIKISQEHIGYGWFDFPEAYKKITFPALKKTFKKAHQFLTKKSLLDYFK